MFTNKKELIIDNQIIQIIPALPRWIFVIFVYFDKHKTPILSKLFDYRNLMFFYPLLIWVLRYKITKYHPNQIHISSFAVAKNILSTAPSPCKGGGERVYTALSAQSPFMYIHNHYKSNLNKLKFPIKQFYQLAHRYLAPWDLKPRHYDHITANSHYTAGLLRQIYGFEDIAIQYPKLDPLFFQFPVTQTRSDYFVFIGRLVTFSKQVDIIIQAFNKTGDILKIIGSGPDEAYLKSIAGPNIDFLGWISDPSQRCEIIGKAKGLINITMESFGYVTVESLCLGVPVIGYNQGATKEIIIDGRDTLLEHSQTINGVLVKKQTVEELLKAITLFKLQQWDRKSIAKQAREKFEKSHLEWRLQ